MQNFFQYFNDASNAVFDLILAPFGHEIAAFDLLVWPTLVGVLAMVVYKKVSNQQAIIAVKRQISMHLLEIRLFRDDMLQVVKSTVLIVLKNPLYIGHNLLPVAVMLVPMMTILFQLVAHYGYAPSAVGDIEMLRLKLDPAAAVSVEEVSLKLPAGISLEAPAVRTADGQVFWRVRADKPGDHILQIQVGEEVVEKGWAVGGDLRKVPVMRVRNWEAVLYPSEDVLPAAGPVVSVELAMVTRQMAFFPDGELGILTWVFVLSLLVGIAIKDYFGVTL
jgi:hypothetical protein